MTMAMKLMIAAIVLSIIASIIIHFLKRIYANKFYKLLKSNDFDKFDSLINTKFVHFLFQPFNVEYLRLNSLLLKGNKVAIDKQFDVLLRMKVGKPQTEELLMKAFNYYVGLVDEKKCKMLLERIKKTENEPLINEVVITHDVFILKKWNHIDELKEKINTLSNNNRAIYEYLISVQYANQGNKEKSVEYENMSKEHMKAMM